MACSLRFNGRPGHARWPKWPTDYPLKHSEVWQALVASASPHPSWQVALVQILPKRWCSGASPATLLRLIELSESSSDVSSFTPDSKAYQIRMRHVHACTGNPNRSHKHERKRELTAMQFAIIRYALRRLLHVIVSGFLRCNNSRTIVAIASQKI